MRALGVTWSVRPRQPVVPPKPPRKKKRSRKAKLNDRQIRAAWKLYESGWSLRRIARELWQPYGFASAHSASVALHDAFRLEGYELRDRIEACRLASTKHGRAPRVGRKRGYKRWLRKQRGDYRPVCKGTKVCPPGVGRPCNRPAMVGSEYCWNHDPERAEQRGAILKDLRSRIAA